MTEAVEDIRCVTACCMGEHKEADMIEEIEGKNWMVVGVAETWRTERAREYVAEGGYLVMAAGDGDERAGVAIIVNEKWIDNVVDWEVISGRLMWMDRKAGYLVIIHRRVFPNNTVK